jgi:prepilin-type N-terminal cleavage/methylation domain-containing protein
MTKFKEKGFTLVELLIVIALIAILSVAVLATINPIEQSNKAKDSTMQNDAAEVMNAYERYYAGHSSYPWAEVFTGTGHLTGDSEAYLNSFMVGAGLCGMASAPTSAYNPCSLDYDTYKGELIKQTELKDSFLNKGYAGNKVEGPTYENKLYIVKQAATGSSGNSIYVCYVPKANANRASTSKLVDLKIDADTGAPTAYIPVATITDGTYFTGTALSSTWKFTTSQDSLFKCVP